MKYDVISFGSAILDVSLKSPDIWIEKTKRLKSGLAIAAPYGEKCEIESLVFSSGGGGTNTAVGFSRLGLKAAVVARCGWDFAGRIIRAELKKENVADEFLVQAETEATDYSTILIGPDGDRTIFVYRGGTRLEISVIDFQKINSFWFYISSLEGNIELISKLIMFAKENNIKVAVNPGRRELGQKSDLLPLLKGVDVLIVNQEEAASLAGIAVFDSKLFRRTALVSDGIVAVTRGDKGAIVFDEKDRMLIADAFEIEMVDATGAGDGFGSGFVAGMARGMGLEKSLKLGLANGASVVTKVGAKAGLIRKEHEQNWLTKSLRIERKWIKVKTTTN